MPRQCGCDQPLLCQDANAPCGNGRHLSHSVKDRCKLRTTFSFLYLHTLAIQHLLRTEKDKHFRNNRSFCMFNDVVKVDQALHDEHCHQSASSFGRAHCQVWPQPLRQHVGVKRAGHSAVHVQCKGATPAAAGAAGAPGARTSGRSILPSWLRSVLPCLWRLCVTC